MAAANKVRTMIAAVHCAIYTRKSTDEGLDQDFNTLDAQRESAEAFIRSQKHEGWVALAERYDDGGFTGANMDRPALRRLLADVRAGLVNCVVVYKVAIDNTSRKCVDVFVRYEHELHEPYLLAMAQHGTRLQDAPAPTPNPWNSSCSGSKS